MRRRALVAGTAVLALVALAVGSFALAREDRPATAARVSVTKDELLAWETTVLPHLQAGGKTVENGMKAAIDDLVNRHVVPPHVIAKEADAWVDSLTLTRGKVAAVPTPEALRPALDDFLAALDEYVAAAGEFKKAALAPAGPQRDALVASGIRRGEAADRVYDRGGHLVQRLRISLGLPTSPNFPEVPDE
jgi:hypothetical protein